MTTLAKRLLGSANLIGFDLVRFFRSLRGLPCFLRNMRIMRRQYAGSAREFPWAYYPCLTDRFANAGTASGAYFHQDLVVAQWICAANPLKHADFGSRVDGFVAHVASFRTIEVFDIRPISSTAANIVFKTCNLMAPNWDRIGYADSISCLHVLEHCGLGRYGDPVDYYGHLLAWENLYKTLVPGGVFYFSVPIGSQQMAFDGQRVFSIPYLLKMFEGKYRVERFACVNSAGELVHAENDPGQIAERFTGVAGCGIFALRKKGGLDDLP